MTGKGNESKYVKLLTTLTYIGAFSASTAPGHAVLMLRVIWPKMEHRDAALQAVVDACTPSPDYIRAARYLLKEGSKKLDLDKLSKAAGVFWKPRTPETPKRYPGTLAQNLGPFSSLIGSYNRMTKQPRKRPLDRSEVDSPTRTPQAPRPKRFKQAGPMHSPRRADVGSRANDDDDDDELLFDHPASLASGTPSVSTHMGPGDSTVSRGLPVPVRRTPTESLVVDFLVQLVAGISLSLQPFSNHPVCDASGFERMFQFGNTTDSSTPTPAAFRGRIDGDMPKARIGHGTHDLVAIFEVKRAKRSLKDVVVRSQQAMEHVAVIWERHLGRAERLPTDLPKMYHTLMIAQNSTDIFVSITTYTDDYIDYIYSRPGEGQVMPDGDGELPMLNVQEYGPFDVTEPGHIRLFAGIIVALLLAELEGLQAGKMLEEVLKEADFDEDE